VLVLSFVHDLANAIRGAHVPGRLQQVSTTPEILLDVGHNTLAAEAVASYLVRRQQEDDSGTVCVLAMLADKAAEDVALALDGVCNRWLCAGLPGERGQTGKTLAKRLKAVLPGADVCSMVTMDEAMQAAVSDCEGRDRILVFGSFVTMAAAADWLRKTYAARIVSNC